MHVLGVKIVNETFEQALERLEPILAGRAATALFFVNAHTLDALTRHIVLHQLSHKDVRNAQVGQC